MSSPPLLLEESTRILVPVTLPDPEPLAAWLIGFLCPLDVFVVGCYVVKDQTSPKQARDQFEDAASRQLDEVVARFSKAGAEVNSRLVFTPNIVETIDRLDDELGIDMVVSPAPVERISNLLCVMTDDAHLDRMRRCISALLEESRVPVTLLDVVEHDPEEAGEDEDALGADSLEQQLVDGGVDAERIETRTLKDEDPAERIVAVSRDFDVVIMSESDRKLRDRLLRQAPCPLLVVRSRSDDEQ